MSTIIVSTVSLSRFIKAQMLKFSDDFNIDFTIKKMMGVNELMISHNCDYHASIECVHLRQIKMHNISKFLDSIPHQPIVAKFFCSDDGYYDIEFSQFIQKF